MKLGLLINPSEFTADPARIAGKVEELGFESLWTGDHIAVPKVIESRMPASGRELPAVYRHVSDPFVVLAMAASVTTTLRLGTAVCVLPNRHPITTALQAATLDRFSGGRLLLGVGAGWLREQIEVMGGDFSHRLAQTREYVSAMRALWSGSVEGFDGRWISFPALDVNPKPARAGGPPVLLGTWGPGAPRRVARWGDGWIPMFKSPAQIRDGLAQLRRECDRAGRDPAGIDVTIAIYDQPRSVAEAAALRHEYAEAGVDRLVLIEGLGDDAATSPQAWGGERYVATLEAIADRFIAA